MVRLGKRLQPIHDLVDKDSVVADIGCDHGLLCIALLESGTAKKAYACDIAASPLKRAIEAIQAVGLENKIIPMLSDGIGELPQDVDTVVIAGMGYETIRKILLDGKNKWEQVHSFILASHTDVEDLRRFLSEHQFMFDQECIVFERHYYQIIKVHYEQSAVLLSDEEIMFGVHTEKEDLFVEYWTKEKNKCELILAHMPATHERYHLIEERKKKITDRLQHYRQ